VTFLQPNLSTCNKKDLYKRAPIPLVKKLNIQGEGIVKVFIIGV